MKIRLIPGLGVQLGDATIRLGDSREQVEEILGVGQAIDNQVYYYESDFMVEYDSAGKVCFIECRGGMEAVHQPEIYGVMAFQEQAKQVLELLERENAGTVIDEENGYSYQYTNISVGIYRAVLPGEIEEMIQEMEADGINPQENEDLQRDIIRSQHIETIGIAVKGYWED